MGFWDNMFGSSGTVGGILGGIGTAATIYGLYQQNQQQEEQSAAATQINADKLAEEQRQFDLKYQLEQQKLAQSGGGGGGGGGGNAAAALAAQIQAAHSRAVQGAHDSLIEAVANGRSGEASTLMALVDRIQKAYSAA